MQPPGMCGHHAMEERKSSRSETFAAWRFAMMQHQGSRSALCRCLRVPFQSAAESLWSSSVSVIVKQRTRNNDKPSRAVRKRVVNAAVSTVDADGAVVTIAAWRSFIRRSSSARRSLPASAIRCQEREEITTVSTFFADELMLRSLARPALRAASRHGITRAYEPLRLGVPPLRMASTDVKTGGVS